MSLLRFYWCVHFGKEEKPCGGALEAPNFHKTKREWSVSFPFTASPAYKPKQQQNCADGNDRQTGGGDGNTEHLTRDIEPVPCK